MLACGKPRGGQGVRPTLMSRSFQYLRGCVYPRGGLPRGAGPGRLHGPDAMLGMLVVMLAVVGIAYAIDAAVF